MTTPTPKEKAFELFRVFYQEVSGILITHEILIFRGDTHVETAIKCAVKCVDKISKALDNSPNVLTLKRVFDYWEEVKEEIKKLQ